LPRASVRLERPIEVSHLSKRLHVDIWVEQDGHVLAIELKYKTRAIQVRVGNEQYALRSQSAQDLGRYDFIKDTLVRDDDKALELGTDDCFPLGLRPRRARHLRLLPRACRSGRGMRGFEAPQGTPMRGSVGLQSLR
jgi:hypothetical protein